MQKNYNKNKNMKSRSSVCLFLYAIVATACFGYNFADEQVVVNDICRLSTGLGSPHSIVEELMTIQARCLNESINVDVGRLEKLTGLEEHRAFFKEFCTGRTATRDCLAAEHAKWASCYNETMSKLFTVVDSLFATSLEKGCVDDGAPLAVITEGYHRYTEDYRARNPFVRECLINTYMRWMTVQRSKASIPIKIWFFYREFQKFKQCFSQNIPENSLVVVSVEHMNDLLDEMKCIHPINEDIVLCKAIDSSLIDRSVVCPLKTTEEQSAPISLMLESRLFSCFKPYEPFSQKLSNASTIEEFDAYFKNYCRRSDRVTVCLNTTTTAAELCLNDAPYKNFELEHVYLLSALEAGCFEEGRRLAKIFYTAKNLGNEQNGLVQCLSDAQSLTSMPLEDPSRMYQFYRELPVARRCVVDKTTGDRTYYDDVNALIDDIMAKMKCVDAQSGSIVFCQTIASD